MHSNQALLESDRQSSTPHATLDFDFANTRSSSPGLSYCISLFDMVSEELVEVKRPDANCENVHDVEHTEKVVRFITGATAFRQDVGKLFFVGINIFDLDFGVQVDSVQQPIKLDSVGAGHMSHCPTSAFSNHLDYCSSVFTNVKQGAEVRMFCVCSNIDQFEFISVGVFLRSGVCAFS